MPLPLIIGGAAVVFGVIGVSSAAKGVSKMKNAKDTMRIAESRHKSNIEDLEKMQLDTNKVMDKIGEKELQILKNFNEFTLLWEKIHNKPKFEEVLKDEFDIPKYTEEQLRDVSIGAEVLLGGLVGSLAGTAGGFAAAGATTAAVTALGTASTGTAIATLKGAALTNSILAALGGGSIATGGGGIALGTTILGGATLGVGLLVGGIIFNITGNKLLENADESWEKVKKMEKQIKNILEHLMELIEYGKKFFDNLIKTEEKYKDYFSKLKIIIDNKKDWKKFDEDEVIIAENTVLLIMLLYNMCKVKIVVVKDEENAMNSVNKLDIIKEIDKSAEILATM